MRLSTLRSRLRDLYARLWLRRLLRAAIWSATAIYFAVALLVLVVRYGVLPDIDSYRGDIERALSDTLARPVTIRAIDAEWRGFWPNLHIHGLDVRDAEGRPALAFEQIEADLAWSTLWHFQPRFARLEIDAPTLDVRRDSQGRLFVAGLEMRTEARDDDFSDWLLAQDRVVIRDATITWHDELRQAPPLALSKLNFDLRNSGTHHRFGLTAEPPRALATRLDLRGDFRGRDLDVLEAWKGQAYAELDHADLAGWRAWIDYPLELPAGSGGLRLWLDFAQKELVGLTADIRLSAVTLRLAKDLPQLVLERVDGRLAAKRLSDGFSAGVSHLALATRDGLVIAPVDFDVEWHPATGVGAARGAANASRLNLAGLAALAGYLPFDRHFRERLAAYAPEGLVDDLHLTWIGGPEELSAYHVKGRFQDLGLRAQGTLPGFAGLDGWLEGNEKGGELELTSRDATIELPAVFADPQMTLAELNARANWKIDAGAVDVRLDRATFRNDDAEGSASGRYRSKDTGPGEIDLSARLTRAAGNVVWRYMPLVVNKDTRDWLQRSIIGGSATATLRLQGDLKRFPFTDGSGIFEIKGPFHGAALRYAPDWPQLEEVSGDLEFVGARMIIRGRQAKLWGVTLSDVKAEIAELGARQGELLVITGKAAGPTGDFLRFIEASPVGGSIDHFTEDMAATGAGELHLRLDMPLRHIVDTQVDGRYRFVGNELTYDPDMPPLTDINGELHFTGDRLEARKIRAAMLGAPTTIDVATVDGRVAVKAAGTMTVAGLRQRYPHPLFEHLAGSAPWSGVIRVKRRAAEVRIESSLQGISSSLPEPFNKTSGDAMPLVFERKPPPEPPRGRRPTVDKSPVERDQLAVTLGSSLRVQMLRRHEDGKAIVERGVVAVGRAEPRLPERGILFAVQAYHLDLDFWRRLTKGADSNGGGAAPAVTQFDLQADELLAIGHVINGARVLGSKEGDQWKMDLKSREASGNLEWNDQGAGHLSGRLAQLTLADANEAGSGASPVDTADSLPAIDLHIDRCQLGANDLGEVKLKAENSQGAWNAVFEVHNDGGDLEGSGRWRPSATQTETHVDFKLSAKSAEKLLARFGHPGAVRRGTASMEGGLTWAGPPFGIDYASLSGKLKLQAASGQFNKLEPGVGRLLGIFSLQSLPRRISLDFRDVFSEGFAFDNIGGTFVVSRGIMDTRDFQIQGPSAKVLMNGSVDLVRETQDLKVRVQPAVGETVATGVLFLNPPIGAAAWVMNKLFGNPLDKAFAFDYAVTGPWTDPKVEKLAAQGPGAEAKAGATSQ